MAARFPTTRVVTIPQKAEACSLQRNGTLLVTWADKTSSRYPSVWLRDNCQCPDCFSPSTKCRSTLLAQLNLESTPAECNVDQGDLIIIWDDGHESLYTPDWLRQRDFTERSRERQASFLDISPILWDASLKHALPVYTFDRVLTDDGVLYEWLCAMESVGVCLIKGAPRKTGQLAELAAKVAFLRRTKSNDTFTLEVKLHQQNVGDTNLPISLHTDKSFYSFCPGMQMLHCIKQIQAEGGETQLSDGFNAASKLKQSYPQYYKILSTTPIDFFDVGKIHFQLFLKCQKSILEHDRQGTLQRVTFSNHGRDSHLNIPLEQVKPFYAALKTFDSILHDQSNIIPTKLTEGDILCFNNHRVLHGRHGWKLTKGGERHLEGGYIDWDELKSCRRVLQERISQ